jgi:guanylate kinase
MTTSIPPSTGKRNNKLIVISAPSGTGKTTLCARLLCEIPELVLSVSTTTRAPRGQEKDQIDYFFIPADKFKYAITTNAFAEWAEVHGNYYGTSKRSIEQAFKRGKSLLLDIDVQGADQLKQSYPAETLRIFLQPPSMEELERRLRARGTDSEEAIAKRLAGATKELAQKEHFDHIVVNADLEKAYFELSSIVLHAIRGQVLAVAPSGSSS